MEFLYFGWLFYLLIPLGFIGGIIWLVVYLVRRKSQSTNKPIDWRRFGVGIALITVLPFFIGFSTSAIFNELVKTSSLIMMLIMAAFFLIIGLIISRNTVISSSLIIGAIISMVYSLMINIQTISPAVMVILVGIALAVLIYFAYKKFHDDEINRLQEKEVR